MKIIFITTCIQAASKLIAICFFILSIYKQNQYMEVNISENNKSYKFLNITEVHSFFIG